MMVNIEKRESGPSYVAWSKNDDPLLLLRAILLAILILNVVVQIALIVCFIRLVGNVFTKLAFVRYRISY